MAQIKTSLLMDEEVDYLEFTFPDRKVIRVSVNDSANQNDLKAVFNKMVSIALSEDVELLPLEVKESLIGSLLDDVFTEYIKDLNHELQITRDELRAIEESKQA